MSEKMSPRIKSLLGLFLSSVMAFTGIVATVVSAPLIANADVGDSQCDLVGFGLEDHPYLIANWNDALEIADCQASPGNYFLQVQDIMLDSTTSLAAGLGDLDGNYDGNGFQIAGLNIDTTTTEGAPNHVGLFSKITAASTIENLTLTAPTIFSHANYVGAFVGEASPGATLHNITVDNGFVSGGAHVGGIAGWFGGNASDLNVISMSILGSSSSSKAALGAVFGIHELVLGDANLSVVNKLSNISAADNQVQADGSNRQSLGGIAGALVSSAFSSLELNNVYSDSVLRSSSANPRMGGVYGEQEHRPVALMVITAQYLVIAGQAIYEGSVSKNPGGFASEIGVEGGPVNLIITDSVFGFRSSLFTSGESDTNTPKPTVLAAALAGGSTLTLGVLYDTETNTDWIGVPATGAIGKNLTELADKTNYSSWSSITDSKQAAVQDPTDFQWLLDLGLKYPVPAAGYAAGLITPFYMINMPSQMSYAGLFAGFSIHAPRFQSGGTNAATYEMTVRASTANIEVIFLEVSSSIWAPRSSDSAVGDSDNRESVGEIRLTGSIAELNADLGTITLSDGPGVENISVEIKLSDISDPATPIVVVTKTGEIQPALCDLNGTGSAQLPFLVATEADISKLLTCSDEGVHFLQTHDIALTKPHVSIGTDAVKFRGTYDGDNHKIDNVINLNRIGSYQGFFGQLGDLSDTVMTEVRNLSISGDIRGRTYCGIFAAYIEKTKVQNVTVTGSTICGSQAALFAGSIERGAVQGLVVNGVVIATDAFSQSGLAVGLATDRRLTLEDVNATGSVYGSNRIGGLVGELGDDDNDRGSSEFLVKNIMAKVNVAALNATESSVQALGGLVGMSFSVKYSDIDLSALVVDASNVGRVWSPAVASNQNRYYFGGMLGSSKGDMLQKVNVEIGVFLVSANNPRDRWAGGIAGLGVHVDMVDVNFVGGVSGGKYVGGILGSLGQDDDFSEGSFFSDTHADAILEAAGEDAGGFAGNVNPGEELDNWVVIQDSSSSGSVTSSGDSVGGFIGDIDLDDNSDGDVSWLGGVSITDSFSDVIVVGSDRYVGGFIGYASSETELKIHGSFAIGASVTNVLGTKIGAGGFIGYIHMTGPKPIEISNSYSSSDVFGVSEVGGFVGGSLDAGGSAQFLMKITESYATGDASGVDKVGGFAGVLSGSVSDSYAIGNVDAESSFGGFVGVINGFGRITNSYAAGSLTLSDASALWGGFSGSEIQNATEVYWNLDTGAISNVLESSAKTFINEDVRNGTNFEGWSISQDLGDLSATWVFCENLNGIGPVLRHQVEPGFACKNGSLMPLIPSTLNTGGSPLNFEFPLDIGQHADSRFSAMYRNVIADSSYQVDAKVTFVSGSLIDSANCGLNNPPNGLLGKLDDYTSSENNRWLSLEIEDLCLLENPEGFFDLKLEFFIHGNPVALEDVKLNIYDVDHLQFVESSEFDSYSLTQDTIITISETGSVTRFQETNDLETSIGGSDDFGFRNSAQTVGRVELAYVTASEINLRFGSAKSGDAFFDLDFSAGSAWEDERGVQDPIELPNPTLVGTNAPSYVGPVVTGASKSRLSQLGDTFLIQGLKLLSITEVSISSRVLEIIAQTDQSMTLRTPAGLALGLSHLEIKSSFGKLRLQDFLTVMSSHGTGAFSAWTSLKGNFVKTYAKNPVAMGKVQFFVNGKEIAWVRATDSSDPKLRTVNSSAYLVRSVDLRIGKNVFEIYLDGERVRRTAYTLR
jgi:hypothetical protein